MIIEEHLQLLSVNRPDLYAYYQKNKNISPDIYDQINSCLINANVKQIYDINTGTLVNNPNYNPQDPTNP